MVQRLDEDVHVEVVVGYVEIQTMVPAFCIVVGADGSFKRGPCSRRAAGGQDPRFLHVL